MFSCWIAQWITIQTSQQNLKYLKNILGHSRSTEQDIFNGPLNRSDEIIKDLLCPLASETNEAQFVDIFSNLMIGTIEVLECQQLQPYSDSATPSAVQFKRN